MSDEPPPAEMPTLAQTPEPVEPTIKQAYLLSGRIVVLDPTVGSWLYGGGRFFGQPVGIHKPKSDIFTKPLELSFLEAKYLLRKGLIQIIDFQKRENLSIEAITTLASREYDDFESKYAIYEDLRDKGYVVRPGLKFGADFGVYKHGPGKDHSLFLVQVMKQNSTISAMQIVLAGRLATTVRKRFVIANPTARSYYVFQWTKL
ncbi:MAG: tRNA intron endonuclease [Promethearchaeota archaeon CR_4]|nr:MAG: tRNA intron endonuclease [Candidatus Lokiarchaeota archaeon CR_4]